MNEDRSWNDERNFIISQNGSESIKTQVETIMSE